MPRPKTKAEYIRNLKIIYAGFDDKDLSEQEFINQMLELDDPKAVARMRSEKHSKSNIVIPSKRIIT